MAMITGKIRGIIKPRKSADIKPVSTVIDGEDVQDIRKWAIDKIEKLKTARDVMLPNPVSNVAVTRHNGYIKRIVANYEYFHTLREQINKEFNYDETDDTLRTENFLQQMMRDKFGMLANANMAFQFKPIDGSNVEQVDFVYKLNQVLPVRLLEEEFPQARIDAIAQASAYGTAVMVYLHKSPEHERHFETLDPLGFLVDFGKMFINGRGAKVSKTFIIVRMRPPAEIEREWGKKINAGEHKNIVRPEEFSLMYAMNPQRIAHGYWGEIPEVMIFYEDQTTELVKVNIPRMEKVVNPDTLAVELDEEGNEIMRPVTNPETGDPEYDEKSTGKRGLKYPDGRLMVFAADQVCYDGHTPYDHGLVPGMVYRNTYDGVNFFGLGDPDIGGDTQLSISEMSAKFQDNIKSMNSMLAINTKSMTDKLENLFTIENGISVIRLEGLTRGVPINEVMQYLIPPIMSQDQFLYYKQKVHELSFLMGSTRETFASESGRKLKMMDEQSMRFNTPMLISEDLGLRDIALMFLYNLRQFDDVPMPYPINDENGNPTEPIMFSGQMDGLYSQDGYDKGIDFPVTVHRRSILTSNSDDELEKLVQIRPLIGDDPLSDEILMLLGNPELMRRVISDRKNRAKIAELLQLAQEAGVFDALMQGKLTPEMAGGLKGGGENATA